MKTVICLAFVFCAALAWAGETPGKSDALIEALKKATTASNPHVRAAAARALGDINASSAKAQLLDLLNDKDEVVSSAAAEALAKIGDPTVTQALIKKLTTDSVDILSTNGPYFSTPVFTQQQTVVEQEAEEETIMLVRSLGQMKDANAVGTIISTLNSPRIGVRIAAAIALGRLKDRSAVKPLINILDDYYRKVPTSSGLVIQGNDLSDIEKHHESNAYLRSAVAWALGEIGDPAAKPVLQRALDDDNSIVRDTAREALDKL